MDPKELRKRAEFIQLKESSFLKEMSPEEIQLTVHELHTYQIELEIQNEELRKTQDALSESLARYTNLYQSAPIGYITLNNKGLIIEANNTIANMLDLSIEELLQRTFSEFIIPDDQDIFYLLWRGLLENQEPKNGEIRLIHQTKTFLWT